MTTTTLACQAPIQSFTAAGVTINQSGMSVDSALVSEIVAAAQLTGVTLVIGGTAYNIQPAAAMLYNPGTGYPVVGTYTAGQACADVTGALFECTVGGSPGTWVAVSTGIATSIDCGSSS